jgi:nucleotide-binding universal stress UspA family protein
MPRMINALAIRHVLCPMDLSPMSINALEWANAIACARRAELRMLHVVSPDGIVAEEAVGAAERERIITALRGALDRVEPGHRHAGAAIRQGDPGSRILHFARRLPADLIVMGAAGAERPERPIGSVTATVAARSDCPVLMVPAGRRIEPSAGFAHIVCAVDVQPSSISVMKQALAFAWETHARVVFVCVMTEPEPSAADAEQHIAAAIPEAARTWCDIEVVVKAGVPATEIVKTARTADADLLVVGPPRQWTSTTQAILAESVCPVLVTHDARPLPFPNVEPRT